MLPGWLLQMIHLHLLPCLPFRCLRVQGSFRLARAAGGGSVGEPRPPAVHPREVQKGAPAASPAWTGHVHPALRHARLGPRRSAAGWPAGVQVVLGSERGLPLTTVCHLRRQNHSWTLWTEVVAIAVGLLPRGHRNIKIRLWRIFYVRDVEQAQIFNSVESLINHSDGPTGAETRGT